MNNKMTQGEAQEAINLANKMEVSGWRRAIPKRYFGGGISILMGSMFAIYALPNPNGYIVFPILGMVIFMGAMREKSGAHGRGLPQNTRDKWKLFLFGALLFALFFITVFIRRAYDLMWVPLFVGAGIAIVVFLLSEQERRAYLAKADNSVDE